MFLVLVSVVLLLAGTPSTLLYAKSLQSTETTDTISMSMNDTSVQFTDRMKINKKDYLLKT
jgi:hypothetical protein